MLTTSVLLASVLISIAAGQPDFTVSVPSTTFQESFSTIWGQPDFQEGSVKLKLDRNSGSGFSSLNTYRYSFFSALIKLPPNYSAGVVTAFYASNHDEFPNNHDEIDFEFLGVVPGSPHLLQTNVYGSGSVSTGREERVQLWFDPTADFHRYSILWNTYQLVFFVDDIPIRQTKRSDQLGNQFPSKPMKLYSTIWDGSNWATNGGRSPVNYDYSPFVSAFTDFKLQGCPQNSNCGEQESKVSSFRELTPKQRNDLAWVRSNHLIYSYCDDNRRYPTPLPECSMSSTSDRTIHSRKLLKSGP